MKTPFSLTKFLSLAIVCQTLVSHAEEPKDLVSLRASWQRAREQALSPLDKKYAEALSALKIRFTKEGNLEAALAVDGELKGLQGTAEPAQPDSKQAQPSEDGKRISAKAKEAIEKRFIGLMWAEAVNTGPGRPFFFFRKDGTVTRRTQSSGLAHGTWKMFDDGIVEINGIGGGHSWASFDSDTSGTWRFTRADDGNSRAIQLIPGEGDPGSKGE